MDEHRKVSPGLDYVLPEWHRRERHRLPVDAPADVVLSAAEGLIWGEVPVFRTLMVGAALGRVTFVPDDRVVDMFLSNGFEVLHRSSDELVIGGIERISRKQPVVRLAEPVAVTYREFDQPGHIKLGFNFRFIDGGVLSTETRVRATDDRARKFFSVYWFFIRAGSGFIRHVWLRAIRRRVERIAAGSIDGHAPDPLDRDGGQ